MTDKILFSKRSLIVYFSVFTAILISFIVVMAHRGREESRWSECKHVQLSGSYSYDGGATFHNMDSDTVLSPTKAKTMLIIGHFSEDLPASRPIYFYIRGLNAKVYVNGKQILRWEESSLDNWTYVMDVEVKKTDLIRVELENRELNPYSINYMTFLDEIHSGTRYMLIAEKLRDNMLSIIASVTIMVMGISILIYRLCFSYNEKEDSHGLWACGFLMVVGGLTCLVDYQYITLLARNILLIIYLDHISQAMIVMFVTAYMKRYLESQKSKNRCDIVIIIVGALLSIQLITEMIAPNSEQFDKMFILMVALTTFMLINELFDLYRSGRRLDKTGRQAFDSVMLLVIAFIAEMVYFILTGTYFIKMFEVALLVFAVFQYYLLLASNVENYYKAKRASELENELTQNKIKMVISQIQPHFLYNAISTIRALCTRNPNEARNALDYFAKYLRANMDSLSTEGCIPFSKELDHVKSYLYIEKLRFGKLLNIEYNIETTEFVCPPLSLQTVAENAVKHGLLAKKEGGTLKITTKENDLSYEIIVEDDGVGFDMTKPLDNGRSHVGLANTRQRIAGLCNGTLNVGSRLGVGTTITIILPKEANGQV